VSTYEEVFRVDPLLGAKEKVEPCLVAGHNTLRRRAVRFALQAAFAIIGRLGRRRAVKAGLLLLDPLPVCCLVGLDDDVPLTGGWRSCRQLGVLLANARNV
jgi:hypothetical protein